MKVVKQVVQYILAAILALAILALILVNLISSTLLTDTYVLEKLDEEDYYAQIYEYAMSKFKNYIPQSGLEEEVLEGVLTEEKVKNDTQIMINNIYNGMDEEIETDEIAETLNTNIKEYLGGSVTSTQQSAIDTLIDAICEEYEDAITHTNYETTINIYFERINEYVALFKKVLLVVIAVCIVLIVLLTIRRIYRILSKIGVAFTIDGLILLLANWYVNANVKVNTITIFNDAFSAVLRNIINDILSKLTTYGGILLALGIVLILVFAVIKSIRKERRHREQYTPEN